MAELFHGAFMPHGYCLQWNIPLLTTFITGNVLVAMAYFSIPAALWWFQKQRKDLAYKWLFMLFAIFITSCGLTHLVKIWTLWHGDYWLEAGLDVFTGLISAVTAVAAWRVLPLALRFPTPTQFKEQETRTARLEKTVDQNAVQLEQLSLAISSMKDYAIILLDENGTITSWNQGASRIKGYAADEIIGKQFSTFFLQEDIDEGVPERLLIRALAEGEATDTSRLVKKDGSTFFAKAVITPIYKNGVLKGFCKVTQDITEKKRVEDEIAGLKDFYETVLNNLNDGVIVAESSGKFIYTNEIAEKTNPTISKPVPLERWSETLGLHLPDKITPYPIHDLPLYRAFRGESSTKEIYLKNESVKEGKWLEVSGTPIKVPTASDLNCGVIVIRDISTRKAYEQKLEAMTEKLNASNKELEAFASAVAHDLQEPLRTMTGFLELLQKKQQGSLDAQSSRYIEVVLETAKRMRTLIRDLLAYTKVDNQPKPLHEVSTDKALDIAILHLQQSIEESGATIEREDLPLVMVDNAQLSLVFQNLIGNAIKYRSSETPVVKIRGKKTEAELVISIQDNGIGFDNMHADRIFTAFKRLHGGEEYPDQDSGWLFAGA